VGDRTIGALCVVRTEKYTAGKVTPFDPDGQQALTLLANSAAIAITNARLAEAKRQEAERSAALSEREQLAADLHDNLAQTLSFLRIKLEWVKELLVRDQVAIAGDELAHMDAAIASAYRQVRAALVGLNQPQPGIANFAEKLTARVDDFRAASGLPVDLAIVNSSALILPLVTQTQILHVVREALANTLQHAQASQVWVRIERLNGQARYIVEDNGVGFDPQYQIGQNHLGLRIMRTRVERSGGELTLDSAIGAGTKIVASFPLLESQNSKLRIAGGSR
jgi:signal transduction histidine kinase